MTKQRGLSNIRQVSIVVKDLKASMERYRSILGIDFKVFTFDTSEIPGVTYRGKPANYRVQAAMAQLGSWEFELVENQRGESIYQEFFDKHGEGVQHLGIVVDDFDAAYAELVKHGLTPVQEGPIPGTDRDGQFAYFETSGEFGGILELLDYPDSLDYPE